MRGRGLPDEDPKRPEETRRDPKRPEETRRDPKKPEETRRNPKKPEETRRSGHPGGHPEVIRIRNGLGQKKRNLI
jgi:hypothetical protein